MDKQQVTSTTIQITVKAVPFKGLRRGMWIFTIRTEAPHIQTSRSLPREAGHED
ncbi:MAG: hypothetical protein OXQ29_15590 [Rhodospirillaceae bacterium]|nr:hypothetical protein [Rhodospirillaceae bacterium]